MTRWNTLVAIDHDRWAAEVYRANFPGVHVVTGAVADQLDALPDADVVLGGPPCQPHSLAGKRKASADDRDGGADFVAAVARVRPRMFLMENVPGLLTSEGGRYAARLLAALESAGYVVQIKTLDAVNFGVPQFRSRCWWWGIRRDLYTDGVRHGWPVPTHAWPPPLPSMFGGELLAGVTVGEALGLDGTLCRERGQGQVERHGDRPSSPTTHPAPTITGAGSGQGGSTGAIYLQRPADLKVVRLAGPNSDQAKYGHAYTMGEPCPTVNAMGKGGSDGLWLQSHADPAQPVTAPSPTLRSGGAGHDGCCLRLQSDIEPVEYHWSPAYRAKHPPASPASSVVGQWAKGLPNGALIVAENWKRKGDLWVRRLSPLECARLQSVPDSFVWPDGITKTAMYGIIGNGWSSEMARVMGKALHAADPDSSTVIDLFSGGGLGATGWHGRSWSYAAGGVQ